MPRENRPTGRDYTPRPPQPHPDARRVPSRVPARAVTEAPRADDGAPQAFQIARRTHVPGGAAVQWVRRVDRVIPTGHGIRMFSGDYHRIDDRRISALPGTLFLICIADRQAVLRVSLYIYLPDDVWYNTGMTPVVRDQGWHSIIRNYVDGWTVLSRVQRVVRACTEAQLALQTELHRLNPSLRAIVDEEDASLARTQCVAALEHFRSMSSTATGDISDLSEDSIRRSFNAWANSVALSTSTEYDTVVATLSDALAEPSPSNEGDLTAQLSDLASWVPDTEIEHIEEDELETVLQICVRVQQTVHEEQRVRDWQYDVLRAIGVRNRQARNASTDRTLTALFTGGEHETVVNYLDRFYDYRKATPGKVEEALTTVANTGAATERQELPHAENRLARNIRIGRRKRNA